MEYSKITNLDQLKRSFEEYCQEIGFRLGSSMIIGQRSINPTWLPKVKSEYIELEPLKDFAEKIVLTIEIENYDA